jgi:hypothetical protein
VRLYSLGYTDNGIEHPSELEVMGPSSTSSSNSDLIIPLETYLVQSPPISLETSFTGTMVRIIETSKA